MFRRDYRPPGALQCSLVTLPMLDEMLDTPTDWLSSAHCRIESGCVLSRSALFPQRLPIGPKAASTSPLVIHTRRPLQRTPRHTAISRNRPRIDGVACESRFANGVNPPVRQCTSQCTNGSPLFRAGVHPERVVSTVAARFV